MPSKVTELFGHFTSDQSLNWGAIVGASTCPYLNRKCIKVRKSEPGVSIGTCTVLYPKKNPHSVMICPHRLLERRKVFIDCIHLLSLRQPGQEYHLIPEVPVPGGSIDYFVAAVSAGRVTDFVGVELQTLDTTGTVWPERQRFLASVGQRVRGKDAKSTKTFGMNWKMTAKTILVQLHHKVETFEKLHKHLVLVIQDNLLRYMRREFKFGHLVDARPEDSLHFHGYSLTPKRQGIGLELNLASRISTDARGMAAALELQADQNVEVASITALLESRLSDATRLEVFSAE